MKYKIITIISILSIFGIFVSVTAAQGAIWGVGPSYINLKDALRGAEPYQQTLFIQNGDNENHTFTLSATGKVNGWITFYESDNTTKTINSTFVQNNSKKTVLCKIFIPVDTANGMYNGTIEVSAKANQINTTTQNASQVELIIPILVNINVTGKQDVNLTVQDAQIEEVEINFPSQISIQFKNAGNVRASPVVKVLITKDGRYIDEISSITYSFPDILPGTISTYKMDWNTTGKISGNYNANFSVTLGDKVIYQKDTDFSLFPPGTFTRNGTIKSITYSGDLKKGADLKIIATFLNTGEVDTNAKFLGEVYKDGQLIGTLESDEKIVRKFQEKPFESYLTLEADGKYRVIGHFLYEGRETNTMELNFNIGSALNSFYLIAFIGAVVCGVTSGGLYLRRKKRKPVDEEPESVSSSKKQTKVKNKKKLKKRIKFNRTPPKIESKRKQKKNHGEVIAEVDRLPITRGKGDVRKRKK